MAYGSKVVPVEDAVAVIRPGDTVATSGFVGVGTPDAVIAALEARFMETSAPRDLTLVFAAAPGDGRDRGLNRLAREGLVRRVIGGTFCRLPQLAPPGTAGTREGHNLPPGRLPQLFRPNARPPAGPVSKRTRLEFHHPKN